MVLEKAPVSAEEIGVDVEPSDIELTSKRMEPEKVACPGIARPKSQLRLEKPMLEFPVTGERPWVKVSGQIKGPPRGELVLKPCVKVTPSIPVPPSPFRDVSASCPDAVAQAAPQRKIKPKRRILNIISLFMAIDV